MSGDPGFIVTGASKGIGAAIALELAGRGRTVACLSRTGALPAEVEDSQRLVAYPCDVTDGDRVRAVIDEFAAHAGGIQGVVNNAGRHALRAAIDVSPEDLLGLLETNCVSALLVAQAAHAHLVRSRGVIVAIGSFFDKLGAAGNLAYAASKAALASINRTLAVEWARDGISVFTVAPGYVVTDLNREWLADPDTRARVERRIPGGRIPEAPEIARLVTSLILGDPDCLNGETIYVDGGQCVRP